MKANELRIGNYILHEPTIDDWEEIIVTLHSLLQVDISPESYCGIPLTEEWLVKFGFEKDLSQEWFLQSKFEDEETNFCFYWEVEEVVLRDNYEDIFITRCQYVHQLQNLYFALVGSELKINENE